MGRLTRRPRLSGLIAALCLLPAGCGGTPAEEVRKYPLRGQVLVVHADEQQLTVRHDDIPGLMPAMTMTFPVTSADLLDGREPGELIVATLEVTDSLGRLTTIARTGFEALPEGETLSTLAAGLLEPGDEVPDTAFVDQDDRRRSLAEWRGRHTVVTFIYTRCPLPNFCPLMDQNFSTIQRAVAEDDVLRGQVALVSISFDPEHDTPAVLAAHAERRRADTDVWTFLSGDRVTVDRFAARFGVGIIRDPTDPAMVTHNLRTAILGPDLTVVEIYDGNEWTPGQVLADLRRAISGS